MKNSARNIWSLLSVFCLSVALLFSCSDNGTGPDDGNGDGDGDTCLFHGPRLQIPDSVFNFGYVPQNSLISHIFTLQSTGCDTLRIVNVVPG